MQAGFNMPSDALSVTPNLLDRASAFAFLEPGQYVTEKFKRVKNRAHRACLALTLLASFGIRDCDDQSVPQKDGQLPPASVSILLRQARSLQFLTS